MMNKKSFKWIVIFNLAFAAFAMWCGKDELAGFLIGGTVIVTTCVG